MVGKETTDGQALEKDEGEGQDDEDEQGDTAGAPTAGVLSR